MIIQKLINSGAKIGDYEFTTTGPNIGVLNNSESLITICDLPGLLEGASDGWNGQKSTKTFKKY